MRPERNRVRGGRGRRAAGLLLPAAGITSQDTHDVVWSSENRVRYCRNSQRGGKRAGMRQTKSRQLGASVSLSRSSRPVTSSPVTRTPCASISSAVIPARGIATISNGAGPVCTCSRVSVLFRRPESVESPNTATTRLRFPPRTPWLAAVCRQVQHLTVLARQNIASIAAGWQHPAVATEPRAIMKQQGEPSRCIDSHREHASAMVAGLQHLNTTPRLAIPMQPSPKAGSNRSRSTKAPRDTTIRPLSLPFPLGPKPARDAPQGASELPVRWRQELPIAYFPHGIKK